MIRNWINQLAADPSPDATQALKQLGELPALRHWAESLGQARLAQSTLARDFGFVHPTHAQVTATLYQGSPANAADIAAIVNEVLDGIGKDIGTSDLNLYRHFWNVDQDGKVLSPRVENPCRDSLAMLMRERLRKYSIECQLEAHHANANSSDIWCTYGSWGVPVEIKRDRHPDLWRAIGQQLIPKYTIDPRAQGFGIYIVLWFGGGSKMPAAKSGSKPSTASQLLQRLKEQVPQDRAHQISVHVIDCCRTTQD